jgi:hypothetical protein
MSTLIPLTGNRECRESAAAVVACNDYLRMGPSRSLAKLQHLYVERRKNAGEASVPTSRNRTLEGWSARFGWQERAEAYDASLEGEKNIRAHEILNSGLALPHERVVKLKELFEILECELSGGALWMKRVKGVGYGENYEKVSERVYNGQIVSDLRGILDDLADETGGRVQRQQVHLTGLAGLLASAPSFREDADFE